jgi:8-amino-7-oxononanoate synthase
MNLAEQTLLAILQKREADLSIRKLTNKYHLVDFCSNDYLGFSGSALLQHRVEEEAKLYHFHKQGATGSRLISGNSTYIEQLEKYISEYHNAESSLMFNSGYDANVGLFSSVPQKGDLIIYDELVHASIRDGIKMSRAEAVAFRHNDLEDLHNKLKMSSLNAYISIESVYSMDGDFAPLKEIVSIAKQYNTQVIVDEAHATGLFGKNGAGLVQQFGLEQDVFARVHTFGKAMGCHGAVVLGSEVLKQFLVNYARSFIFTTALPFHSLVSIKCAYDILAKQQNKIQKISYLVDLLKKSIQVNKNAWLIPSESPIQSVVIPGNDSVKLVAAELEKAGFYAKAILYPTVPKGAERIRICIHSFNTEKQVLGLTETINSVINTFPNSTNYTAEAIQPTNT